MKKRKGVLAVLLTVMLVAGVTACGSKNDGEGASQGMRTTYTLMVYFINAKSSGRSR